MEVVVYHTYNSSNEPLPQVGGNGGVFLVENFLIKVSKALAVIGISLLLYSFGPSVFYWAKSGFQTAIQSFSLSQNEVQTLNSDFKPAEVQYQPRFDPTLSKDAHLKIASIGVDTVFQEATYDNYEEALKKGVWRVSDFGAPSDSTKPTILAAHRFGYLVWTNTFRRRNSFFNLPKLKVGDTVEITWRQRKYVYEIYSESEGEAIADYSADLILYTCEALTGPERIFKYARLLEV